MSTGHTSGNSHQHTVIAALNMQQRHCRAVQSSSRNNLEVIAAASTKKRDDAFGKLFILYSVFGTHFAQLVICKMSA